MNPALPTLIGIAAILIFGGIAGHFNSHPKDWPILVSAIKGGLSHIKQCLVTWPITDTLAVLLLALVASAWVISFI